MREWMIKNWGIALFIILAITWILVCTVIGVANAAEIVTLGPGQEYLSITYSHHGIDTKTGTMSLVYDTVIVKAEEADTNRTVWSKCPRCDWPQAIEAPRHECKKKPRHPLNGLGPGWSIDGIYTCTHPECTPKPDGYHIYPAHLDCDCITCKPQTQVGYDIDKIVSVLLDKFWNDTVPWLKGVPKIPHECKKQEYANLFGEPIKVGDVDPRLRWRCTHSDCKPIRYECKKPCHEIHPGAYYDCNHICTHPECAPEIKKCICESDQHLSTLLLYQNNVQNKVDTLQICPDAFIEIITRGVGLQIKGAPESGIDSLPTQFLTLKDFKATAYSGQVASEYWSNWDIATTMTIEEFRDSVYTCTHPECAPKPCKRCGRK